MSRRIVLVDADMLAGWRRVTPSFAQLREALSDLARQEPGVAVAVVADPSLKWDLDASEQDEIEQEVRMGRILYAPAGCVGGQLGFIARIVAVAAQRGLDPVVITDQHVAGAPLGRVRRDGPRWVFDLESAVPSAAPSTTTTPSMRRRRRRSPAA